MIKLTNMCLDLFLVRVQKHNGPFSEDFAIYSRKRKLFLCIPWVGSWDSVLNECTCKSPAQALTCSFQTCTHNSKTKRSTACSQFQLTITKVTVSVENQSRSWNKQLWLVVISADQGGKDMNNLSEPTTKKQKAQTPKSLSNGPASVPTTTLLVLYLASPTKIDSRSDSSPSKQASPCSLSLQLA
jgi:hypothetical protein